MKNKRIEHISKFMWKRHGIFTENLTIFSSIAGKILEAYLLEMAFTL